MWNGIGDQVEMEWRSGAAAGGVVTMDGGSGMDMVEGGPWGRCDGDGAVVDEVVLQRWKMEVQ